MKEFFVFMVLPVLVPPLVGSLKGSSWGFGMVVLQLLAPLLSFVGLRLISDPYTASAWFACSIVGLVLVSIQALAARTLRRSQKDEEGLGA